jgi:protein-disulfide isomerase
MDKKFWTIVSVVIVIFIGFLMLRNDGKQTSTASNSKPTSHIKGEGTKVTLTEYGDFQCPACSGYYPVIEQLLDKYSAELTFQFRHFPLTSLHTNAFAASRAAEAASKQDKFWEMYDKLYANQSSWSQGNGVSSFFESYANEIGLNLEKYRSDYKSDVVNGAINADMAQGRKLDVAATPTFFVNGKVINTPPQSVEAFSEVLDKAIAENKQ